LVSSSSIIFNAYFFRVSVWRPQAFGGLSDDMNRCYITVQNELRITSHLPRCAAGHPLHAAGHYMPRPIVIGSCDSTAAWVIYTDREIVVLSRKADLWSIVSNCSSSNWTLAAERRLDDDAVIESTLRGRRDACGSMRAVPSRDVYTSLNYWHRRPIGLADLMCEAK